MDLTLALVEEDLGSKVALAVARDLVLFLKARRSSADRWLLSHRLENLCRNFCFVENLDQDLTVENLASRAAMSRRNFPRVFARSIGNVTGSAC